jgi:hypothetical protein
MPTEHPFGLGVAWRMASWDTRARWPGGAGSESRSGQTVMWIAGLDGEKYPPYLGGLYLVIVG